MTSPLQQALALENQRTEKRSTPRDFQPGIQYAGGRPDTITTGVIPKLADGSDYSTITQYMDVTLPDGARLELIEARFDPVAWTRERGTIEVAGEVTKAPAITRPAWRYRFRVVYEVEALLPDTDLAEMVKAARRKGPAKRPAGLRLPTTKAIDIGDPQIGKVDSRGDSEDLLVRIAETRAEVVRDTIKQKPSEIILADLGDIIEGFESSPNADRTNDLSLTQQLRLARRIMFDWVVAVAPLAPKITVVGVPSNHCRIRRGKQEMGDPLDDFGIENIHAVADICAANPERFGHVEFVIPNPHEEAVAIKTLGGKVLGYTHGHQTKGVAGVRNYFAGQALGRTDVGQADILNLGHWHNLNVQTLGDDRWAFVVPPLDNGSAWHTNTTGEDSRPGVLTYMVDENGWYDMRVAWGS